MIDTAVRAVLVADPTLVAMLGTFEALPAVFVQGDVPASFVRGGKPYVVLRDSDAGPPLDGDRKFFTVPAEVLVLGKDEGDAAAVEAAAWRVRALLDGIDLAVPGHVPGGVAVTGGPSPDDPDDLTFGRLVTIIVGLNQA